MGRVQPTISRGQEVVSFDLQANGLHGRCDPLDGDRTGMTNSA